MRIPARVVVIGGGGHAHVVIDVIRRNSLDGRLEPVAVVDSNPSRLGREIFGVRVEGSEDHLSRVPHDAVVIAIGDNRARGKVFKRLASAGESFINAAHPSAVLADDLQMGGGNVFCAGAIVNPAVTIGNDIIINTNASIDHHCSIGSDVHIAPGVQIGGACRIEDGALVGIGATLLPEIKVGADAVIGAGAVVVRDVPAGAVVVGNPATLLRNGIDELQ